MAFVFVTVSAHRETLKRRSSPGFLKTIGLLFVDALQEGIEEKQKSANQRALPRVQGRGKKVLPLALPTHPRRLPFAPLRAALSLAQQFIEIVGCRSPGMAGPILLQQ